MSYKFGLAALGAAAVGAAARPRGRSAASSKFNVGDEVIFGRPSGEQTLGRVIRVNPKSLTIEQMEERGTRRLRERGTKWRVAPSLVRHATAKRRKAPAKAPKAKRKQQKDPWALQPDEMWPKKLLKGRDWYEEGMDLPNLAVVLRWLQFNTPEEGAQLLLEGGFLPQAEGGWSDESARAVWDHANDRAQQVLDERLTKSRADRKTPTKPAAKTKRRKAPEETQLSREEIRARRKRRKGGRRNSQVLYIRPIRGPGGKVESLAIVRHNDPSVGTEDIVAKWDANVSAQEIQDYVKRTFADHKAKWGKPIREGRSARGRRSFPIGRGYSFPNFSEIRAAKIFAGRSVDVHQEMDALMDGWVKSYRPGRDSKRDARRKAGLAYDRFVRDISSAYYIANSTLRKELGSAKSAWQQAASDLIG